MINGTVNRNVRCVSTSVFKGSYIKHPSKINVWAGYQWYHCDRCKFKLWKILERCQSHCGCTSKQEFGQEIYSICVYNDGALAQYVHQVWQYLQNVLPRRWIGRRDAVEWPARSHDLTPLNYFFWGLHEKCYIPKEANWHQNVQETILQTAQSISEESIFNAVSSFYTHLVHWKNN